MTDTSTTSHDGKLADLERQVAELNADIEALAGDLSDEQLAWRPPDGGWSIGQVLEHLVVTAAEYDEPIEGAIAKARAQGPKRPSSPWRPSFMGAMIARALDPDNTKKGKAPKIFDPGPTVRPEVLSAFLDAQANFVDFFERSKGLDLRRARLSSPVNWLIRMNLGDAYTIHVVHVRRHLLQMYRIREGAGFPAS